MDRLDHILRQRKLKGVTWDYLAESLPVKGNALRTAFTRRSVSDAYLEVIERKLDITYNTKDLECNPDDMFKKKLRDYLKIKGVSQYELAELVGDTQQAVSDFLSNDGNPQKKTREKYFENLEGFREFYETSELQEKSIADTDKDYIINEVVKKLMGELEPLFEIAQMTALDVNRIRHKVDKIRKDA
tara:strand:- start:2281 stop:2841 length:561 start_codon:yes stop_codon:yes gene_type:complete